MASWTCTVSFTDHEGILHSVHVQAESMYEAVALAVKAFREHDCEPGSASQLEVEVTSPSVTHKVSMAQVRQWLNGATKGHNEKLLKERLKALIAS